MTIKRSSLLNKICSFLACTRSSRLLRKWDPVKSLVHTVGEEHKDYREMVSLQRLFDLREKNPHVKAVDFYRRYYSELSGPAERE